MKNVLVFFSHDNEYIGRYNKLKNELEGVIPVVYYSPDWKAIQREYGDYMFKDALEMKHLELRGVPDKIYCGNTIFAILYLKEHILPGYTNYWIMEYDCLYTGNYKDMFKALLNVKEDVDVVNNKIIMPEDWFWRWHKPNRVYKDTIPDLYQMLFQFYMLKSTTLDIIKYAYTHHGVYGHHELVLPSIILKYKLKVKPLDDFINNNMKVYTDELPDKLLQNILYHPVK